MENKIIRNLICYIILFCLMLNTISSISDSENVNNNMTIYVEVHDTRNLDLVFVPIDNMHDYVKYTDQMAEFVSKTFPLDDSALQNMYGWNTSKKCCPINSGGIYSLKFFWGLFLHKIERSVKSHYYITPERIVGVLPKDWFKINYRKNISGITLSKIGQKSVLVERGYQEIAAHELGHTYGLCDEYYLDNWFKDYDAYGVCGNMIWNEDCEENGCPGVTFGKLIPWSSSSSTNYNIYNFMGWMAPWLSNRWITADSYDFLLDEFKDGTPINVTNRILISGVSNKSSNIINFDNLYLLGDGFAENASEYTIGNYSIVLIGNSSNVLVNLTFDLSYVKSYENATDENISYFVYVLEFPTNTTKIRIYENGIMKDEVNVSAHAPTVNLTYPNSSAIYRDPFNITWNAYDADGNSLYYAISLSYDNGSTYSTVELDYNNTYYTIEPNNFLCGSNYKAEVMVTDGVRTNTSQTVYNFSLVPNPSVDVEEIDVIYMNDTKVIFEIKAINDGCDRLQNHSWTFDLGDGNILSSSYQTSLEYDEELQLFIEYNYSLGGQKTVNFSISNGSVADYLEYDFEIPNINISNYSIMYSNKSVVILEYRIKNMLPYQMGNVSWSINTGQNTITNNYNITLESEEEIFMFLKENFNAYGTYYITFNASDGINKKTVSLVYDYREIDVYNLSSLYQNETTKESIFEFSIGSLEDVKNVSWKFNGGELWLNSTINSTINDTDSILVFVKQNYSSTGAYEATALGLTNVSNDTASTIVII